MNIPIAIYNQENDFLGLPQEIKSIKFYPIKLMDNTTKDLFNYIFSYSKSQMYFFAGESVLQRLIKYPWLNVYISKYQMYINKKGNETLYQLKEFLSRVTDFDLNHIKIGYLDDYIYDCNTCIDKNITIQFIKENEEENKIEFIQFDSKEFDTIRQFIIQQNGRSCEYIDEWNESFEEDLAEYVKTKNIKFTSFSDDIFTYRELSNLSINEIKDMTLCQFLKGYEKAKQIKDYELIYNAYITGKIKSKNELTHYSLPCETSERYSFAKVDLEEFQKNNNI